MVGNASQLRAEARSRARRQAGLQPSIMSGGSAGQVADGGHIIVFGSSGEAIFIE